MLKKYCGYQIPKVEIPADNPLRAIAESLPETVAAAYDRFNFNAAGQSILSLPQASNKYLEERAPWTLYKQGEQAAVEAVLYSVLESVRITAILLSPMVPSLSLRILEQLGYDNIASEELDWEMAQWGRLIPQQLERAPKPVFQRLS